MLLVYKHVLYIFLLRSLTSRYGMVKSVEYITPAVQENISTAHFVLVRAKQTIPRKS